MFQNFVSFDFWGVFVTIANLCVMIAVLKHFLFVPVRKVLADREFAVQALYDQAENDRVQAEKMKADYAATLASAKDEAIQITAEAKTRADVKAQEIISQAHAQATDMKHRASVSIEQERKMAMNDMKDEIADLSIQIAEKVVAREVDANDHKRLIDAFIEKVG